jgi:ligand-binding sensor domain-containing protein
MDSDFNQAKGLFYSEDLGMSWEEIKDLPNKNIIVVKSDPISTQRLWVGTNGGGSFRVDLPLKQIGRGRNLGIEHASQQGFL